MDVVAEIEEALVAQWSHFGRWPRGALHDRDGLVRFETPIRHLPYNGVVRSRLPDGPEADARIAAVVDGVRRRHADLVWFVTPSATPADLGDRLRAHGLGLVEVAMGMSLELAGWRPAAVPGDLAVEEVHDDEGLRRYSELNLRYWEIPPEDQALVLELQHFWRPGRTPGHRFIAVAGGVPVGKAYLSLAGAPGVAAVFGMAVVPEARGRGVAGALAVALLQRARDLGRTRVVLHATEMAVGLYRRAGFVERCAIPVYATAPVWSHEH